MKKKNPHLQIVLTQMKNLFAQSSRIKKKCCQLVLFQPLRNNHIWLLSLHIWQFEQVLKVEKNNIASNINKNP
jgi:hypothetical protein